jgi:hypothetical protein
MYDAIVVVGALVVGAVMAAGLMRENDTSAKNRKGTR